MCAFANALAFCSHTPQTPKSLPALPLSFRPLHPRLHLLRGKARSLSHAGRLLCAGSERLQDRVRPARVLALAAGPFRARIARRIDRMRADPRHHADGGSGSSSHLADGLLRKYGLDTASSSLHRCDVTRSGNAGAVTKSKTRIEAKANWFRKRLF